MTETTILPDGREVAITALVDEPMPGLTSYRAEFPGAGLMPVIGSTPQDAIDGLLMAEHRAKMLSLRQARRIAGIGGGHGDADLPAGYRSYVTHLDGDPYNNDPANLMIVKGREQQRRAGEEWPDP